MLRETQPDRPGLSWPNTVQTKQALVEKWSWSPSLTSQCAEAQGLHVLHVPQILQDLSLRWEPGGSFSFPVQ